MDHAKNSTVTMSEDVFFSIIIPTFNAEKTLAKALQSIVDQTFSNYEVLLIDGLSSDSTMDIIREFAEKKQQIRWISEKDNGIYDAMNKGINLSRGKWLYFLGSDDQLFNNEVLHIIFKNPESDNFNVVYGNVRIEGNTTWAKDGEIYDGEFDLKKLFRKNICHQDIFYRTKFIKEHIGYYNARYELCADWDFNLRCRAKTDFLYTDQIIAKFNAGGESTKTNLDQAFSDDFVPNLLSYYKITVFDPLINDPSFPFYNQVLAMQKDRHYMKYLSRRIKKFLN
jgi:glycosyltransferase involved in cell wall biosynthesis